MILAKYDYQGAVQEGETSPLDRCLESSQRSIRSCPAAYSAAWACTRLPRATSLFSAAR